MMQNETVVAEKSRRSFIKGAAAGAAAFGLTGIHSRVQAAGKREFTISLAAWSLHREIYGGKLKSIQVFKLIKDEYAPIGAFELVNNLLEVPTLEYVNRMRHESKQTGIDIPLIMIDSEGALGAKDAEARKKAVLYHTKWIHIASDMGCRWIRVNWAGTDKGVEKDPALAKENIARSVDAYRELVEIGQKNGIEIIIENHGGASYYPEILTGLMKAVNSPHFGTLPDFGNFPPEVDRYDATDKLMPYAKAVSAKCYDFGPDGNDTKIDFERMLQICVDKHGYHGNIGIEYEGDRMPEREGIKAALKLLVKLRG